MAGVWAVMDGLGRVSSGESLSARARSGVRELDQQLRPVCTKPRSSGAAGGSSSPCGPHLCLFLPSLKLGSETTVSLLTGGVQLLWPPGLLRWAAQAFLPVLERWPSAGLRDPLPSARPAASSSAK